MIPDAPLTFTVQGGSRPSIGNRSYIKYSIKIKTNGTVYGTDFNSCYVLTCTYTNSTPITAINNMLPNIYYQQIKEAYLYNALQYDNGYYYSTNETWVKMNSTSCG